MRARRLLRPAIAAAVLTAGMLLGGCTSTPEPSPTATTTTMPRPTASTTPSPTPTRSAAPTAEPSAGPTDEPPAAAAYDLEAAYATCVELSQDSVRGMSGAFEPFDPADTNPIGEEKITTDVSDDPDALMMHVHWKSDTSDLEGTTFCSISGPFDAPVVKFERGSSNQ